MAVLTSQLGLTVKQFEALDKVATPKPQGGIGALAAGFAETAFRINNIIGRKSQKARLRTLYLE
jgi:hypothetical protein